MSGYDLHTHLAPSLAAEPGIPGVAREPDGRLRVDGHRVGLPGLYRPGDLAAWADGADLDAAVVSAPPPFFRQWLDLPEATTWVPALNAGILDAVEGEDRLLPIAYLPLEHPTLAVAEAERLLADDRWAGFCASAGGRSVSLADPALAPLWQLLNHRAALLMLHPGTSPDARLDEFYLSNLLGNPVETAVATAQLVFGDVLARHPRMRVLLVHCGGSVPGVVGRWDRGVDTDRPGLAALTERPSVQVRRCFADCLAHDPRVVDLAVEVFGADRIVLGSDWPFPMGTDDPRALVAHRGPAFARQVAEANGRAALGR